MQNQQSGQNSGSNKSIPQQQSRGTDKSARQSGSDRDQNDFKPVADDKQLSGNSSKEKMAAKGKPSVPGDDESTEITSCGSSGSKGGSCG